MSKELEPFKSVDTKHFTTKGDDLYWKGKKLKRGGWDAMVWLAIIAILVTLTTNPQNLGISWNLARNYLCKFQIFSCLPIEKITSSEPQKHQLATKGN